ncbi:MAG: hypothetical protein K8963_06365, partial [Proteobacteria bacterium]|nr:hypothetical protein [Pseudomonadota bacterium]
LWNGTDGVCVLLTPGRGLESISCAQAVWSGLGVPMLGAGGNPDRRPKRAGVVAQTVPVL